MWHFRFFGTILSVLALLGLGIQPALAATPTSSKFSVSQLQETRGLEGSFQLAVMGGSAVPLDIPTEKFPKKVQSEKPVAVQPENSAVEKPKATPKKASKPKKKKVKTARVKKAPKKESVEEEGFLTKTFKQLVGSNEDKNNPASKSLLQKSAGKKPEPEKKEEEGLFTRTLNTLVGSDDDKKDTEPKPQSQKTAENKSEPEKKEEGLLTRTLKTLVGGDKQEEKTSKKDALNPINLAPTGSATHNHKEEQPKTAKSETKQTLKSSFEKLIGVGAASDEGDSPSSNTDKPAGETKSTKKEESGGLLDGILGGDNNKKAAPDKQQAKVQDKVQKTSAPANPKKFTPRKYPGDEEGQLEKDRGGVKKGKNVLKESFKTLITDDKKKEDEE